MSITFLCDDKDTLVAYVYDEMDPDLRRAVAAHLRTCTDCASEVEGLQSVRRALATWQPPEAELNFKIVQKPATVLRPSRWSTVSVPMWAQAAAAVLVLATGSAVANLQVHYGTDGLTIRTGWMAPQTNAPRDVETASMETAAVPVASADWRPALTALETDLRRELQSVRASQSQNLTRVASPANVDSEALLRRVQALVNESEQRQRQELAIRMAQFGRDVQGDLVRMNQGFRQLQGRTGVVEGSQREMMNYLRRVSTQQVP